MNINLKIERLILKDVNFSPYERRQLQAALESELSRLLAANPLPPYLQNGGAIPQLPATLNVTPNRDPSRMGQEIAQSLYTELNR